jgi:uncharacterized membrane protein YczE
MNRPVTLGTVLATFMLGVAIGYFLCFKTLIAHDDIYVVKSKKYDTIILGGSNETKN